MFTARGSLANMFKTRQSLFVVQNRFLGTATETINMQQMILPRIGFQPLSGGYIPMRKIDPIDRMPYHPRLDDIDDYDFENDCFIEDGDIASQPWEMI
jgi:hypothetical protein